MATISESIGLVKKHFDTYKKNIKNGASANTQIRNYYNHFSKLLISHEFDEEDCNTPITDFFDELINDPNFNHTDRMPDRWSRKTWAMSFESIMDVANILKDILGNDRLQKVIEKANYYNEIYSNPDANIKEIDVTTKKVIDTNINNPDDEEEYEEEEEDADKYGSNFDFSNISKLFGNFGGANSEAPKPDKRLEIIQTMMRKMAINDQDRWSNILCDTIADLLN